jgi:hypothetical protein
MGTQFAFTPSRLLLLAALLVCGLVAPPLAPAY